jgi:Leucine-rich repeat (LRR) protein
MNFLSSAFFVCLSISSIIVSLINGQVVLDQITLKTLVPTYTTATTIDLSSKSIFFIDALVFNYSPQVFTTLTLTNNLMTAVSAEAFKYCTVLRTLIMSKNKLDKINPGAFSATTITNNLQVLDLSYTDILGTNNLVELRLNNNNLTSVENLFRGSSTYYTKLTTVYLNSNFLTTITTSTFSFLTSLTKLYLNDNKLVTIPSQAFFGLVNLQYVYLADNPIATSQPFTLIQLCLNLPKRHICLYTTCTKAGQNILLN